MNQSQSSYSHYLVADSYAEAAEDTLVRISYDKRMIIFEFDGVLLTCKSFRVNVILVSEVYQLTFKVIVTSAFQTSRSLCYSLFFCESFRYYFAEIVLSFFRRKLRNLRSAHSLSVFKSLFGDVVSFDYVRLFIFENFAVQISVYAVSGLPGVCDGFDGDGNLVISAVSAGKYAWYAGHESIRVISDGVLSGLVAVEYSSVYSLTDSQNHGVDG